MRTARTFQKQLSALLIMAILSSSLTVASPPIATAGPLEHSLPSGFGRPLADPSDTVWAQVSMAGHLYEIHVVTEVADLTLPGRSLGRGDEGNLKSIYVKRDGSFYYEQDAITALLLVQGVREINEELSTPGVGQDSYLSLDSTLGRIQLV